MKLFLIKNAFLFIAVTACLAAFGHKMSTADFLSK